MAEQKGCHGGETKNGATATYPKMMPRQHIGSGNSIEIPMQDRSVRMSVSCKGKRLGAVVVGRCTKGKQEQRWSEGMAQAQ